MKNICLNVTALSTLCDIFVTVHETCLHWQWLIEFLAQTASITTRYTTNTTRH